MTEQPAPTVSFYPVSLDVSGRPCLVVGGGRVAARKARGLIDCGAVVTVIAPSFGDDMEALVPALHRVERRPYGPGDAAPFRLVVTATGLPAIDGAVFADAEAAGVWINSADDRAHFLLHPPGGVPRRRGDRVGLHRGPEPRAVVVAARPAGRGVRRRYRSTGTVCSARPGLGCSALGRAATRLTGPDCSTALFSTSSGRATWTMHGQL